MKRTIQCFLLMAGLSLSAVAQPEPVQTVSDFGLKGPVKRVSEVKYDEYLELVNSCIEFDVQGRLSKWNNSSYAYDVAGRLVVAGNTYYAYDENGLLLNEQKIDSKTGMRDVYKYNYTKERLTSCSHYKVDNKGKQTVLWDKVYRYDKQGRLMGAEAKTPDKKNSKLVFSYQVLYASDGTLKNYVYTHHEEVYDEYGEIVKGAGMVSDTLPCNEKVFYAINHYSTYICHQEDDSIQWTRLDNRGNGVYYQMEVSTTIDPEYDEYGEMVKEGHDTVLLFKRSRAIEYYGEYDINVSAIEMNVLYYGIDNPVKITVQGVPDEFVVVGDEDDKFYFVERDEMRGGGNYVIGPRVKMGLIRIPVKAIVDGQLKKVGEYAFRVRTVPDPKLYLDKYESGNTIPIEDFKNMKNVAVRMGPDFAFRMKMPKVLKQNITITKVQGADDLETKTADWNPEILSYVQKTKPGNKVYIEVMVEMPDGNKRCIPGQWNLSK